MTSLDKRAALVLFSGGQDSSIALAWALSRFDRVHTIGFDYSQRHIVELGARSAVRREIRQLSADWASRLADDVVVNIGDLGRLGANALTREAPIADNSATGLPTTFVPGRNLIFLTFAGAAAYNRDAGVLVAGMCEADYSGYPDCRARTIDAQAEALRFGMDADIEIATPLMQIDKAASWRLAEDLGGINLVSLINEHSHTCYLGVRDQRRDWGYGCGACPACDLRAKGWAGYVAAAAAPPDAAL